MQKIVVLIYCCIVLASCSKVETASNVTTQTDSSLTTSGIPTPTSTIEAVPALKPIVAKVKLNSKQRKNLNESLPPNVREILEKAEKFEVLAEVDLDDAHDGLNFEPNRISFIRDEKDKKEILENFYYDASAGPNASACYIPHHGIRASYQGKTVEVEICFQCHLFSVNSSFGKFYGGLPYENVKSEELLNRLIQNQSVELKQ